MKIRGEKNLIKVLTYLLYFMYVLVSAIGAAVLFSDNYLITSIVWCIGLAIVALAIRINPDLK